MQQTVMDSVQLAGSVAPIDLSVWGLFMHADWVGRFIIFGLLLASVWTWAVIFDKSLRLRKLRQKADLFEEAFWSGQPLDTLYERINKRGDAPDPLSATFAAGMREWRIAADKGLLATGAMRANLQGRIERVMSVTIAREIEQLEAQMSVLASVGSVAPFVGLFGTVWGIMRSFIGIAGAQNTSLAVVAPGIAEALLATAIGLFAAIPAVVAYNKFSSELNRFGERLDNFANEFNAMISRRLEEQRG